MVRRAIRGDPEQYRLKLIQLLEDFDQLLENGTLRQQVRSLIPAHHVLRNLGTSLMPKDSGTSARDRILAYFQAYSGEVIAGDELMIVAGISEYARRIRELRVQFGWKILSGMTLRNIGEDQVAAELSGEDIPRMGPDEYLLVAGERDRDSAYRWNLANEIRKSRMPVRAKILRYLRSNVGEAVSGEELAYLARNASEWARRVRELRTEHGWPIVTKQTGNPNLPVGVYVLERDRQAPAHDRRITDFVRVSVLNRDQFRCQNELDDVLVCNWEMDKWNPDDPRFLELHHVVEHAAGGSNEADNLITVCNVCHDEIHRRRGDGD